MIRSVSEVSQSAVSESGVPNQVESHRAGIQAFDAAPRHFHFRTPHRPDSRPAHRGRRRLVRRGSLAGAPAANSEGSTTAGGGASALAVTRNPSPGGECGRRPPAPCDLKTATKRPEIAG